MLAYVCSLASDVVPVSASRPRSGCCSCSFQQLSQRGFLAAAALESRSFVPRFEGEKVDIECVSE